MKLSGPRQESGGNPADLAPMNIVRAPTRLTAKALIGLTAATGLWACIAQIPIRVNGLAILIPVDGIYPVTSPGTGSVVYPIRPVNGVAEYAPPVWSEQSYNFLKDPSSFSDATVRELAEKVLNDTWAYKSVRADMANFGGGEGADKTIRVKEKSLVAFITNAALETKLITLVAALEETNRLYRELEELQRKAVSEQQNVVSARQRLIGPLKDLVEKGYSSRVELIQAEAEVASQRAQRNSTQAELHNTQIQINNNHAQIRSQLAEYLRTSALYSFDRGHISEIIAPQWQEVQQGSTICIIEWGEKKPPSVIPVFLDTRAASEVGTGMQTISTPIGFSVSEVGGIKGTILNAEPLPLDQNQLAIKLGSTGLAEAASNNKSLYQFNMQLKQQVSTEVENNWRRLLRERQGGYQWNNNSIPPLKPRQGMLLTTQITTRHLTPLQMLIPSLKEWGGLDTPKKLQDAQLNIES